MEFLPELQEDRSKILISFNNIFIVKIKGWDLQVKTEMKGKINISVNHFLLCPIRSGNLKGFQITLDGKS
jgi:hypothetical protein